MYGVKKIISGGQTGADRGGLDAAISLGIPHGGWCPKNRKAEDGKINKKSSLKKTSTESYLERTEKNIVESDATIIFVEACVTGGSMRTLMFCEMHDKPFLTFFTERDGIEKITQFLQAVTPSVLNIAGNRESKAEGIQGLVQALLRCALDPELAAMRDV